MFETNNLFNGAMGKIAPGMCRLTMNGGIAVKCSKGYKTYNMKKDTLTNVTNFCFNMGDEMFFVMPTTKVKVGDIILVDGRPKCVLKSDRKRIEVIDYETSEVKTIVPERHIFMGNVYFYGKIVSLFGGAFKGGKGMKNIMQMMVLSQMFGNGSTAGVNGGGMFGNMGQMMVMSQMFGGSEGNMFADMFNEMSFDEADEDELEDEDDNEKESED